MKNIFEFLYMGIFYLCISQFRLYIVLYNIYFILLAINYGSHNEYSLRRICIIVNIYIH